MPEITEEGEEGEGSNESEKEKNKEEEEEEEEDLHKEVMQFNTLCEKCHRPAETNMKVTEIPHFKVITFFILHITSFFKHGK